jgi:hypothetical protein
MSEQKPSHIFEYRDSGQTQCEACRKLFMFNTYVKRDFISEKADCLNGGAHRMRRGAV